MIVTEQLSEKHRLFASGHGAYRQHRFHPRAVAREQRRRERVAREGADGSKDLDVAEHPPAVRPPPLATGVPAVRHVDAVAVEPVRRVACSRDYCWHSWKNAAQMPGIIVRLTEL